MPISEGILIPLYLAPERRDESTPLGAKKAKLRRSAVAAEIPALTVPGGRFTLTIEDNNTPVFFDRDKGKVERLAPLDSPIIQIGFSKEFTRVGVGCQDGSSVVWDIGNLKRNTKTNQPLQTALGLADVSEESRQKLLKTSSAEKLWQAGCTELGNEWLLRALSTVTRSPEDYREFYQPRNDAGKALTQTFHEAIQLAGANKAEEAISLLTQELSRLGFKTQGEMQAQARAQLKNVLVSSALNRVMEEFQNLRLEMDSVDPANLKAEFEPRNEKLVLALDPSFKDKIDAQKEIHRGNVLASQGDAAGAIQAYQKAKGLDPALQDLKPEEQVKQFVRSLGTGESSREAAIQKINFGNEAALRGELDRAIALYREAIALDSQLAKSLDPEAEARKWNERRNAPMKTPAPGRTPPEATQIRE